MNTRTKIVAGVVAGVIGGASLMGAAFAAPRVLSGTALGGYRMMGAAASSGRIGIPTVAEMQNFMQNYRNSSGGIDVNRMHADVASGKVTPPCLDRANGGVSGSSAAPSAPRQGRGFGMMGGSY